MKKSIIPILIVLTVVIFMMDFGDGNIDYKRVSYEHLSENLVGNFMEIGPGGTGMFEYRGYTYAFITTKPSEKVEILFVGNAQDGIGHEVRYKVHKRETGDEPNIIKGQLGNYSIHLIRLERNVGTPFGFNQVNLGK